MRTVTNDKISISNRKLEVFPGLVLQIEAKAQNRKNQSHLLRHLH